MRLRVVLVTDYFPPSERGGAVRALAEYLCDLTRHCEVHVITRDHDALTGDRLTSIESDHWTTYKGVRAFFASPAQLSSRAMLRHIRDIKPHVIYLNSLFSTLTQRVLWARRFGAIRGVPLVMAPEGELSPGALMQKHVKKRAYLALARGASLYRGITWKVASPLEEQDVCAVVGPARIRVVANVHRSPGPDEPERSPKQAGHARLLFLSRISPKKNLPFLLSRLANLRGAAHLEIVGPIEDDRHWNRCRELIRELPPHVTVRYAGACHPDEVWSHYAQSHALVLPTAGENFGYVIQEALAAGCPVLTTDQTPWTELESWGAGWTIPLEETSRWTNTLNACVAMDPGAHATMSAQARLYSTSAYAVAAALGHSLVEALSEASGTPHRSGGTVEV